MTEEKANKQYVAVIGDLVGSKSIDNRQAVQEKLLDTLSDVNSKFKTSLYAGFIVTTGDEFQALAMDLKSASSRLRFGQSGPFQQGFRRHEHLHRSHRD